MLSVPDHLYSTHHRGHNSTKSSTCATRNRLQIFNKLEVSRLDSTLSLFIIISSYIQTLSWCQIVVRIKLLPRPYEQDFAVNFYSD